MLIVAFIAALTVRGIEPYSPLYFIPSPTFLFMLAVNVDAVIMPFMLFFQASATAEKVIHTRKKFQINNSTEINSNIVRDKFTKIAMKSMRLETLLGAVVSEMLMVVVEMVMSGIGPNMNFCVNIPAGWWLNCHCRRIFTLLIWYWSHRSRFFSSCRHIYGQCMGVHGSTGNREGKIILDIYYGKSACCNYSSDSTKILSN